ncbi:DEAD/DEAH box helicase [Bacillus luteolus]|uniref:DEAD/DEAH box helicase n=1 Tax=Litchfieldia luteola TaxID=682179 RepID=A0ABR9QQE7_9BACI|nr:DEAD/DEAH box helicase [Cytobacillus luteolus]MBE4910621.1 DEAD/DEAH box helicase [Cytobacillus luteolus]
MSEKWDFLSQTKPFLQEAWEKSGFASPTAVQVKAAPQVLEGKDIIVESPTGTGKTLAYLMPLLNKIDPEHGGVQALILASSHELVMQINLEVQKWAEGSGIRGASFIGGANVKRQLEKLKKRPQVVVGTPGRVSELIKQKKLKMHEVKTIVLDEGDQLLVPEHTNTVENIIKTTLADRQIVLFSATMPAHTERAARVFMNNPEVIKVTKEDMPKSKVDHIYFVCDSRDKVETLEKIGRLENVKALTFVKDIGNLAVVAEKLQFKRIPLSVLHSDSKKEERANAIKSFRAGKVPMLVATDVAARGLDIEGLSHVVHFDLAEDLTQYTHRSGRTGRAGAAGTVISIVTEREERTLKQYARELGFTVSKKVFFKGQIADERKTPMAGSQRKGNNDRKTPMTGSQPKRNNDRKTPVSASQSKRNKK